MTTRPEQKEQGGSGFGDLGVRGHGDKGQGSAARTCAGCKWQTQRYELPMRAGVLQVQVPDTDGHPEQDAECTRKKEGNTSIRVTSNEDNRYKSDLCCIYGSVHYNLLLMKTIRLKI